MSADVHQRLEALVERLHDIDAAITLPGYASFRHGTAALEDVVIDWLETLVGALDDAQDELNDRSECRRCSDLASDMGALEDELARARSDGRRLRKQAMEHLRQAHELLKGEP